MDNIFNGLNQKQIEAVKEVEGRIRVIAGPGAGKTKCMVHHYAFLVQELGINPSNILAITFTNKAANELKARIDALLGNNSTNDFICTIHSLCVKILRSEIYRIAYPRNFTISDDTDCKDLASKVLEDLEIDKEEMTANSLLHEVASYKARTNYIGDIVLDDNIDSRNAVIRYIQYQRKYFYLDFDDLLYFALYILNSYKDALDKWQRFEYILLDEAHDCNPTDYQIMNLLSEKYGNLYTVFDIDQCIYEFRASDPNLLLKFKSDSDVTLEQNYRSTQSILDVANSVIKHNQKRIDKTMFTENAKGIKPIHYHGDNEQMEAKWIVDEVKQLVADGKKYSDIAILYRASFISRTIEQELLKNNITYTIWGGVRFYDRKEVKDMLSYLKVVSNGDDMAFERIINTPSRKFGKVTLSRLRSLSIDENTTLYDTLKKHIKDKDFQKEPIIRFVEMIEFCRKHKDDYSISDILDELLVKSGLKKLYKNDSDQERLDNINELISSVKEYEKSNVNEEVLTIDTYLQDISLFTNMDRNNDENNIKLMTIHQSKGLEFPIVFVCGINEGTFPSARTIRERHDNGLEEERRIFYVAITRAMDKLYLTESGGYNFITSNNKEPSRFFDEIDKGLVDEVNCKKKEYTRYNNNYGKYNRYSNNNVTFDVGEIAMHTYFGKGEIIKINGDNSYMVDFGDKIRTVLKGALKKLD